MYTLTVDSLATYLECLKKKKEELMEKAENGDIIVYRGHAKEEYEFMPSIFRENNKRIYDDEDGLLREIEAARPYDFSGMTALEKLAKLQHYGFPTRLLDVTLNPLVALYFSVRHHEGENDGAVILCRIPKKRFRSFDSDTAMCLANLANLSSDMKKDLDNAFAAYVSAVSPESKCPYILPECYDALVNTKNTDSLEKSECVQSARKNFNASAVVKRFVHLIRADRPYFAPEIIPEDLYRSVFVRVKQTNPRIQAQNGAFLVFGMKGSEENKTDYIHDWTQSSTAILKIKKDNKANIRNELNDIGISEETMFPELEPFLVKLHEDNIKL